MPVDKELVLNEHKKGRTKAAIARELNISRERVGQILSQKQPINANLRKAVLIRDNFLCQFRENCKSQKKLYIWHLDRNKSNIRYNNLITVCADCQNFLIALERGGYKMYTCGTCNKDFRYQNVFKSSGSLWICRTCIGLRKKYWCQSLKADTCVVCKTNIAKHHAKGVCTRCSARLQYHNNVEFRKRRAEATKKWNLSHPEALKKIQKRATQNYLSKHRDRVNKKQNDLYHKQKEAERNLVPNLLKLFKERGSKSYPQKKAD